VATQQHVWVGLLRELFRIEVVTWAVARGGAGSVTALALDGQQLWIGTRDSVLLMNLGTLSLRTFSAEDFGFEHTPQLGRFEPDREVPLGRRPVMGCSATTAWRIRGARWRIQATAIQCISLASWTGQVWADVLPERRIASPPARVDRRTLAALRPFNSVKTFRAMSA